MKIISRTPIYYPRDYRLFSKPRNFFPVNQNAIEYFAFGRAALFSGIKLLSLKENDEVLIPEYICKVALAPFKQLKIRTSFYRIGESLKPDWGQINESLKTQRVKAILIVNYFGFPNDLIYAREFCDKNDLFLIEDNAHGFLSSLDDKPLGSLGDISIFSFHKTIPISNGAALVINNQEMINLFQEKIKLGLKNKYLKYFAKTTCKSIGVSLTFNRKIDIEKQWGQVDPDKDTDSEDNVSECLLKMGSINLMLLNRLNIDIIKERRRSVYFKYLKEMNKYSGNIKILFPELGSNIVPYVFPVLCNEQKEFLVKMWREGIEAFPWPFLPKDSKEGYFSKRMVCLPIN